MDIVTILGSPRRRGNTDAVLRMFEERMKGEGHRIERVNLGSAKVNPCLSCWKCMKSADEPGCPQKDDAAAIFGKMIKADGIVYATPLYCWCFSAQMKALLDRHVCLVKGFESGNHRSFVGGKATALLVTCEGPVKGNADLIPIVFDRMAGDYTLMKVVGKYIIPGCGLAPGSLPQGAGKMMDRMAAAFGKKLGKKG